MSPRQPGVFLSYARSDGAELAFDLRRRLEAEGLSLWQDRGEMEGGRDWWLQIVAALDAVEFMVLVMTPAALSSPLVRREWRYARQRGVCVYPVQGASRLDFDSLPRWMRSVHFYDLDYEWPKLLNDLRTRCERRRVPFMAEDLPPEFIARPAEFDRLLSFLLDREREEPLAITAALRAAGGYGKTVLARALCHHEDIQNAFDDGILWVTLGENPGDLTGRVEDLIYLLSGQRPGFASLEAATALLVELLADRDILIVLDDVWDAAQLKPFLQGGRRCARLITTRNLDTLPADASRVDVGAMQESEAVALLGYGLPKGHTPELKALAGRLGEWPLLLKLANAALRDRVQSSGQALSAALAYVNKALDRRGLTFFDARDASERHQAVARTLELSIERLRDSEQERFTELAAFAEDVNVPLTTVEALWKRTGGLDEFDTEQLVERLNRLSLVLAFDPAQRYVRLHDIIRRLLVLRLGDRVPALHGDLLDACRPASGAWADLPPTSSYMWDHLADHLAAAGHVEELVASVLDLRYLAAKTLARTALAAEGDLRVAEAMAPRLDILRTLRRSFVQSGHILNRCEELEELKATLHARLSHVDGLAEPAQRLAASISGPHVQALHALPDLPHPALIRTMSGGSTMLWGCAISPDGSFIVSADYDGVLTVWDARTFTQRARLTGHTSWAGRCAVSPDSSFIVSTSFDRRLRIWDAATGKVRHVLAGHTDGVTDCAISPDGRVIVSTSLDETIKVWDAESGALARTLAAQWEDERGGWFVQRSAVGHLGAVWACAISGDGAQIVSASSDQTLRIWDVATGREERVLTGHTAMVTGCAFSPDGTRIASAGADGTLRIWNGRTGVQTHVILGHSRPATRCAFSPDGAWIVSASADGTLKLWDFEKRERTLFGHTDIVNDCAVSPDGSYLVSASMDGTLKVWDTAPDLHGSRSAPHRGWVNSCAGHAGGELVASASSDARLKIWNVHTGMSQRTMVGHEASVRGCIFGPSASQVISASADKSLKVWDVASGATVATMVGHTDWVNDCAISPRGDVIVSASNDRTLRFWDARTWAKRLRIVAHDDSVNVCAFSADGAVLVSASTDESLKVWNVQSIMDLESILVDQRFTRERWDETLRPLVLIGHSGSVNDCAISPDGTLIASASADHTVCVWDARTGQQRHTLTGHRRDVNGCAISPDGMLIASASQDATLKVWSLSKAECIATLHVDGALADCMWLPDGRQIVATGAGGVYFLRLFAGARD